MPQTKTGNTPPLPDKTEDRIFLLALRGTPLYTLEKTFFVVCYGTTAFKNGTPAGQP